MFSVTDSSTEETEQHLIQLVIPTGQLATPTTLVIGHVLPLFSSAITRQHLVLKESTGRVWLPLTDIALTPSQLVTSEGLAVANRLAFDLSPSSSIGAGQRLPQ